MKNLKSFSVSLAIPLIVGAASALLTMNSMDVYKNLNLPSFAPPSTLFPFAWTILYILMGISSYIIYESNDKLKNEALSVYTAQLIVNFIWPLIFFNGQMYMFAFVWLLLLCAMVIWMMVLFYKVNPVAAYLQIPYILWIIFAACLNFAVYSLN